MRELDRPAVFLFRKDGGSRDFRMAIPCRNFVGQEHIRHSRSSKNDCRVRLKRVACQKSLFNPASSVWDIFPSIPEWLRAVPCLTRWGRWKRCKVCKKCVVKQFETIIKAWKPKVKPVMMLLLRWLKPVRIWEMVILEMLYIFPWSVWQLMLHPYSGNFLTGNNHITLLWTE